MANPRNNLDSAGNFEDLFYSSRDAINIYDDKGHIINSNPKSCEMLGYSRDELVHLTGPDIIHPKYHRIFEKFLNDVSKKGQFSAEAIDVRKDGSSLDIEVWGTRIMYNGKPHSVAMVRDITDLRKIQKQLATELQQKQRVIEKLIHSYDWNARQISRELHDNVGQTLTSIKMDIENILTKLNVVEFPLEDNLISLNGKTVKAIKEIKDINLLLRPVEFDDLDLVSSIRNLVSVIEKNKNIQVQFFTRGISRQLDHTRTFALYRTIQEAFTNILKHAHAKKVFVHLYQKEDVVKLTIEDDGIGFDLKDIDIEGVQGDHLGVHIMRHRTVELGGQFSIDSTKGKGTVIMIELPFA